jgi:hypothetical protein
MRHDERIRILRQHIDAVKDQPVKRKTTLPGKIGALASMIFHVIKGTVLARRIERKRREEAQRRLDDTLHCRRFGHEWDYANLFLRNGAASVKCGLCGTIRSSTDRGFKYIYPEESDIF